ncbi:unnamed protein product [Acidithrix sp. C25]|nr:unnamed protein product [Acidithrix sp. C25]
MPFQPLGSKPKRSSNKLPNRLSHRIIQKITTAHGTQALG